MSTGYTEDACTDAVVCGSHHHVFWVSDISIRRTKALLVSDLDRQADPCDQQRVVQPTASRMNPPQSGPSAFPADQAILKSSYA